MRKWNPILWGLWFLSQMAAASHPRLLLQVFQGSPQLVVTSIPQLCSGIQGRNQVEQCKFSSMVQYFCRLRGDSPTGNSPSHLTLLGHAQVRPLWGSSTARRETLGHLELWGQKGYLAKRSVARKNPLFHAIFVDRSSVEGHHQPQGGGSLPLFLHRPTMSLWSPSLSNPSTPQWLEKNPHWCEKLSNRERARVWDRESLNSISWCLGNNLKTLWSVSWLFLLLSLCWLQVVSPGLAAPWGKMLLAFWRIGKLDSRHEKLWKSRKKR